MREPHRPRTERPSSRRALAPAFTIVELLIVIGIIAVLISILVGSLGKAREQARRTKCMANQRTLAQGVQAFALEHQGYGQLIPFGNAKAPPRYLRGRYEYETWPQSLSTYNTAYAGMRLFSPWPIAYASYIGAPSLRSEDFFVVSSWLRGADRQHVPGALAGTRKIDVLRCPSEPDASGWMLPTQDTMIDAFVKTPRF